MLAARSGHVGVISAIAAARPRGAAPPSAADASRAGEHAPADTAAQEQIYDPSGPLRLEECDASGLTALQWACARDQAAAVERLVSLGADVEARDPQGRTCLIVAAHFNAVACLDALVAGGALLDAQAADGSTASIAAAREGRAESLAALVRAGASCIRPANHRGETALSLSSRKVLASVLDADPSRLFLHGRDHWTCWKTSALAQLPLCSKLF